MKRPQQPEKLILASNSPRRRSLLEAAGYLFTVHPADDSVEAAIPIPANAREFPLKLARAKAQAIAALHEHGVVLAADTIAICDGQILGKPSDREHARRMLEFLSGREHEVLTAIHLIDIARHQELSHLETTRLQMDQLAAAEIEAYLATNLWCGKAGAFGYQDGWDWLDVVTGSESNVVGLPIERLPELFVKLNTMK